jgi:hypothetical protein
MGDTEAKRQVRGVLSARLDSYYETLMEAALRDSRKRWEQVLQKAESPPSTPLAR